MSSSRKSVGLANRADLIPCDHAQAGRAARRSVRCLAEAGIEMNRIAQDHAGDGKVGGPGNIGRDIGRSVDPVNRAGGRVATGDRRSSSSKSSEKLATSLILLNSRPSQVSANVGVWFRRSKQG
jgi:hypothetical protein